jgi:hypothetical protein
MQNLNDKLEMPLDQFAEAVSKENERLRTGPGGIMEMKQTIADKEAEIARLKEKCDKQAMILRRLTPEKHPNTLFISGILGHTDENNMPKKILVTPAYGVDFSYVYEYNGKMMGQEW